MAGKKIRGITIELGADTSNFEKAMKGIDKSLNATQRELRDVDKLLKFDPKNTTLLKQKQDLLKSAIGDTENKLKEEKEALQKLKKADKSPEVEKQMRALERQIIDDERKLDNFNDELRETGKAASGVEAAKDKFKKFGKGLGAVAKGVGTTVKVGATAVAAVGTAGAAASKAIGSLAKSSSEAGDEVDKMSQKLGLSRKGYQEWGYVLGQAGVDINSLQTGMKTMTNQIGKAKGGTKESVEAFEKLGISMDELNGMSREDAFKAIVKGMQGMEDSTERAALANKLFGKSGQNLTPLFNETAQSTEELIKQAHEMGAVMGDEAVDASAKFQDQLDGLKRTFEATKNGIGSMMLPALTDVMGGLQMLMVGDNGGAEKIEKGFTDLFNSLGKMFEKVGTILEPVMQGLMSALPTIISSFTKAIIRYAPTILQMLIKVIDGILTAISQNAAAFSSAIVKIVMMLVDLVIRDLPLLLQVGVQAIIALATGLAEALPKLTPTIVELILKIVDMIIQNLPLLISAGIQIITGLLKGLMNSAPILLSYIPKLLNSLIAAAKKIVPMLIKVAKSALAAVKKPFENIGNWFKTKFQSAVKSIKGAFSGIGSFFSKIWSNIKSKFKSVGSSVGNAIGGAFKKVINGVLSTVENAINKIPGAINKMSGALKKVGINIHVPTVKLPRLATGGVSIGETLATIGDNPTHREAVLPLNDPKAIKILKDALGGGGSGATVNQTINVGQMSSYREAYLIKRATEQGIRKMMRA